MSITAEDINGVVFDYEFEANFTDVSNTIHTVAYYNNVGDPIVDYENVVFTVSIPDLSSDGSNSGDCPDDRPDTGMLYPRG